MTLLKVRDTVLNMASSDRHTNSLVGAVGSDDKIGVCLGDDLSNKKFKLIQIKLFTMNVYCINRMGKSTNLF